MKRHLDNELNTSDDALQQDLRGSFIYDVTLLNDCFRKYNNSLTKIDLIMTLYKYKKYSCSCKVQSKYIFEVV